tara:strand:- start:162 stop:467 length:306 start_codon:yes stop_codon:yes gene_type:complete
VELISQIKRAYLFFQNERQIKETIKQRYDLKLVIEELGHYPKPILILAIIEAVKKSIINQNGSYSRDELFDEVMSLISMTHNIQEHISAEALLETINQEVH